MTKPREKNARNCKPRLRTERRKSGSLKTGKRCCGKSYPKRNAGRAAIRLIVRGAVFESIVPEAKTMTDEEAAAFLRLALTSEEARGYLKKTHRGREKRIIPLVQRAHLYTLTGACALPRACRHREKAACFPL